MVEFPSQEWLDKYVDALNNDPSFFKQTKGWVWVILFVVDEGELRRPRGFLIEVSDGVCRRHQYLEDASKVTAPYRLLGSKQMWLDLISRKIDPTTALGQGKIRVIANQATLGRFVEAARALLERMAGVGAGDSASTPC
ncbi:MAG: hypothetical protein QW514_05265 [Thermoprotei archaeon]